MSSAASLVMFTGYLLALSKPVRRALEWIASFATSPRAAVTLMAFASMALASLNWGLSIVASIVEAHGGRAEVDTAPGEGSTFRIVLPTA